MVNIQVSNTLAQLPLSTSQLHSKSLWSGVTAGVDGVVIGRSLKQEVSGPQSFSTDERVYRLPLTSLSHSGHSEWSLHRRAIQLRVRSRHDFLSNSRFHRRCHHQARQRTSHAQSSDSHPLQPSHLCGRRHPIHALGGELHI